MFWTHLNRRKAVTKATRVSKWKQTFLKRISSTSRTQFKIDNKKKYLTNKGPEWEFLQNAKYARLIICLASQLNKECFINPTYVKKYSSCIKQKEGRSSILILQQKYQSLVMKAQIWGGLQSKTHRYSKSR